MYLPILMVVRGWPRERFRNAICRSSFRRSTTRRSAGEQTGQPAARGGLGLCGRLESERLGGSVVSGRAGQTAAGPRASSFAAATAYQDWMIIHPPKVNSGIQYEIRPS